MDADLLRHSAWASHAPILVTAAAATKGNIIELGAGLYSTPILHCLCASQNRKMVSVETTKLWMNEFLGYESAFHRLIVSKDPAKLDVIGEEYGLAFIDIAAQHRAPCIRLLHHACLVVVHDTEDEHAKTYKWDGCLDEFKFRKDYVLDPWDFVQTTVLSDFIDPGKILP